MASKNISEIIIKAHSKKQVLEKIIKYIRYPKGFMQIISLNPENLVTAQENKKWLQIIKKAQIKIVDGVGIVLAARILGVPIPERVPGRELVEELMMIADRIRLRVLFIGGRPNLALKLSKCYNERYPKAKFLGIAGIKNIKTPLQEEEEEISSIVSRFKPHLLFAAFGSPDQELWLERHRDKFSGIVCMGVGGTFDYLAGIASRPSRLIRNLGLEWLFRLINQPWRWRRQLRIGKFLWLLIKEKIK